MDRFAPDRQEAVPQGGTKEQQDAEHERFAMIPEWIIYHPNLEGIDVRLYAHLSRKCGLRGWWYGRQARDLAAPLAVSVDSVKRSLRRLRQAGAVDMADRIVDNRKSDAIYRTAFDCPGDWADWPRPTDWTIAVRDSRSASHHNKGSGVSRRRDALYLVSG
jgi:hypothetical protein